FECVQGKASWMRLSILDRCQENGYRYRQGLRRRATRRTRRVRVHHHRNVRRTPYRTGLRFRRSRACGLQRGDADRSQFLSASFQAVLLFEIKAGEVHVGGAGDFKIALGAEDDEDVTTETLDQRRFIGGSDTVLLCFAKR